MVWVYAAFCAGVAVIEAFVNASWQRSHFVLQALNDFALYWMVIRTFMLICGYFLSIPISRMEETPFGYMIGWIFYSGTLIAQEVAQHSEYMKHGN